MRKWVFDVDGTVTPSRGVIDEQLRQELMDISRKNKIYFITGSDKQKTIEQIGEELYNRAGPVFNCR